MRRIDPFQPFNIIPVNQPTRWTFSVAEASGCSSTGRELNCLGRRIPIERGDGRRQKLPGGSALFDTALPQFRPGFALFVNRASSSTKQRQGRKIK
jgi:hypothetical protein